jgi:hypothetical protein
MLPLLAPTLFALHQTRSLCNKTHPYSQFRKQIKKLLTKMSATHTMTSSGTNGISCRATADQNESDGPEYPDIGGYPGGPWVPPFGGGQH